MSIFSTLNSCARNTNLLLLSQASAWDTWWKPAHVNWGICYATLFSFLLFFVLPNFQELLFYSRRWWWISSFDWRGRWHIILWCNSSSRSPSLQTEFLANSSQLLLEIQVTCTVVRVVVLEIINSLHDPPKLEPVVMLPSRPYSSGRGKSRIRTIIRLTPRWYSQWDHSRKYILHI